MKTSERKSTTENFEVDSALLSEIGEKLVTTPHVALSELVKNAYDADATEVHVMIKADANGLPTVEVRDNGHGMTRKAVHDYWMRIGTTNKEDDQYSPDFGRRRTGAKGIGRFACRRLGRVLDLETVAILPKSGRPDTGEKYQCTRLSFRWIDFRPGSTVSTIPVYGSTEFQTEAQKGLRLSISDAQSDEWSYRGYAYLKRQLAALCANQGARRNGYKEDPGFQVYLTAPGLQEEDETADLREQLMNAGWGTLIAHVDKEGRAVCTLVAKGIGKRSITSGPHFTNLTDVRLHLGIFPMENEWLRDKSVVSKSSVSELCDQWGGVQVRYRGFRIYPYGDELDDWLNLETDRARRLGKPTENDIFDYAHSLDTVDPSRSLLNMLSMKSYLGAVEIGSNQQGLEPKADRMGFLEGTVFREIKRFSRFVIDWAMVIRDFAVQLDEAERRKELRRKLVEVHKQELPASESAEDAIKIMRGAIREIALHVPTKSQAAVELLQDATAFLESTIKITTRDLLRLRLVASGATLTLLFAHEVRSLASTFASISKSLSKISRGLPKQQRAEVEGLGYEVAESHRSLSELLELTNAMGVDQKAPPIRIDLREAAQRSAARFARVCNRYNIEIDLNGIPEGLLVGPMREGELFAVLINSISNSVKAVIAGGGQRLIGLKAEKLGKHVQLDVLDTGVGLSAEHFVNVFTPMISDPSGTLYDRLEKRLNPEDGLLLGRGSGLGLAILRGILQARNGDATMLPPVQGWKCHLRLNLP
jgi:signal transduction histidine kinase